MVNIQKKERSTWCATDSLTLSWVVIFPHIPAVQPFAEVFWILEEMRVSIERYPHLGRIQHSILDVKGLHTFLAVQKLHPLLL